MHTFQPFSYILVLLIKPYRKGNHAVLVRYAELSLQKLGQFLRHGQADAVAGFLAVVGFIAAVKALEEVRVIHKTKM